MRPINADKTPSTATIFIDASVANIAELLPSLETGAEVITLNADEQGLTQIAKALTGRTNVNAVHILSHGTSGSLELGNAVIDTSALISHFKEIGIIRTALAENADLLIYGCHVAEGEVGQSFISLLSEMTGANVAASVDATGAETLGGNWDLEFTTGKISAKTLSVTSYDGLLALTITPLNTGGVDAITLANAIMGSGTTVVSATVSGAAAQVGTFTGAAGFSPSWSVMDSGVVFSTGNATGLAGPNNSTGFGDDVAGSADGVADFNTVGGGASYDASYIDITFVPTNSVITLQFVFGSEEYLEYVDSGYSDGMGVWVNNTNIALTPAGSAININTINNNLASALYVDNPSTTYNTQMDGFTRTLGATIPVNPGVNNTIRIGIADIADGILDSWLMIKADSAETNTIALSDNVVTPVNTNVIINVKGNDFDVDGDPLTTIAIADQTATVGTEITLASGGKVTLQADGTLLYKPLAGSTTNDLFTYTISDGTGNTATAFVNVGIGLTGPIVTSQTTNDTTPVISGTTSTGLALNAGEVMTVEVNGATYTVTPNSTGNWSVDLGLATPSSGTLTALTNGAYDVTAKITKGTGVAIDSTSKELTIDTVAPATPTVVNQTTSDTTPVITGTAIVAAGETLTVTVSGATYTVTPDAAGNWSLDLGTAAPSSGTLTALVGGTTYPVTAKVTDAAGNISTDTTTNELNISSPKPTVDSQSTSDTTPVITGTTGTGAALAVGDVLTVTVSGATYTVTPDAAGLWSLDLGTAVPTAGTLTPLTDGSTYPVAATVTDAGGNSATDTTTNELKIDTTAPMAPTVNALLTNDTTPVITGTTGTGAALAVGEVLTVTVSGATYTVTPDAAGLWSLDLGTAVPTAGTLTPLTDGSTYPVSATVTDAAGNSGTDTTTNELKIDTTAPMAPTVNALLTNDTTPVITGTVGTGAALNPGEVLTVTVSGATYTVTPDAAGLWSLDLGTAVPTAGTLTPLTDGSTYPVTATVTDAAGNAITDLTTGELKIDTTISMAPTVNALVTNDTTPVITGTTGTGAALAVGEVLTVTVSGATYTVTPDAAGLWSLDLGTAVPTAGTLTPLTDGSTYPVTATVADAAGNATTDSSDKELVVDTGTKVAITAISQDSGTAGDFITNDSTLVFSGTAEVGSSIVVKLLDSNNQVIFSETVLATTGTWSVDYSAFNLSSNTYQIFAEATDTAGNKATASQLLTIQTDITASNVDITTATDSSANDLVTANGNPQVTLQAPSGLTLTVNGANGVALQAAQYSVTETPLANGQSSYIVTLLDADLDKTGPQAFGDFAGGVAANNPANATDGPYQIVATNVGSGSSAVVGTFTIDTSAPAVLTIDLPASADSGLSNVDNITSNSTVILSGMAEPNSTVNLYKPDGSLYAKVTTNQLGEWQVAGIDLTKIDGDNKNGVLNEDGDFTFTAKAVDIAGNESPVATLKLTLDRTLPSIDLPAQFDSGESNSDNLTNMTVIGLQGNAPAGSQVQVKAPDGSVVGVVTTDPQGHWTLANVTLSNINNDAGVKADGLYTFAAEVLNANGQPSSGLSSKVVIELDTKAPDKPLALKLTDESDLKSDNTLNDITNTPTPKFYVSLPSSVDADVKAGYILKLYAAPVAGGTPQLVATQVLTNADVSSHTAFMVTDSLGDNRYNFGVKLFDQAGNALDTANTVAEIRTDLDGVAPNIEDAGSKGGDFNGDGKQDYLQNAVATFPVLPIAGQTGSQVYAAGINAPANSFGALIAGNLTNPNSTTPNVPVDPNAQLENVAVIPFTDPKFVGQSQPSDLTPVTDPLQFTIAALVGSGQPLVDLDPTRPDIQTRLVLEIPEGVDADTFVKFGPTPGNATPHFFEFLADGNLATYDDGAELFRNAAGKVDRVVLTLTDNGIGDTNPAIGVIADPGYLALRANNVPTPTPTPTGAGGGGDATCANDTVIDGVTAETTQVNITVVPVVTAERLEDTNSANKLLADIPVVSNGKDVLLQVSVPEHVGFTAEELVVPCNDFTLRELLINHAEPRVEPLAAFNNILQQGIDKFLPTVADEKQVMVRTLIFNQDNTTLSGQPIIVTGALGKGEGDAAHPLRQEALVIDAHTLPAGTVIQLDNVEFAIVIGDVKVIGGAGSNFVMGDDGVQVFSTTEKNDVVMGNIGDDTLTAGTGHNLMDGGAGVDTMILNPTGDLRVYLTRNAANKENPYDQVVVDVASGEQTIYRNVEKVNLNGTVFDLGFLNLPGSQMETLGVLSQLLFNQAPGVAFVAKWGAQAGNAASLVAQVLATDAAKAVLGALNDADFAKLMVQNGLGSSDAGAIKFVADYLQTHSRAELVELAIKAPVVIDHAYSFGGLAIIAGDHTHVNLVTEAEVLPVATKTEQVPLPTSTHTDTVGLVVDGTAVVDRHIERLVVPIVTAARVEDTKTANSTLADIPVIKNGNEVLLNVGLPVSVGVVAEEIKSDDGKPLALRDLLVSAMEPRIEPLSAISDVVKQGIDSFVAGVKDATQVAVRTLIFSQDTQTVPNEPIVIQGALGKGEGDVAHPLRQEALVIDAHTLAAGTTIQLNNVEFAVVIGNVKVIGGNGSNFIIADDADQNIMTGAGDDTLIGGAGNDRLNGGWGNDLVDGGIGEDTLVYDFKPNDPLHVYLTHNSADKEHPYDTVVVNGRTGDHTIFRNVEKADLNDTIVDIKYLEQAGSKLEKIGVLSQFLLGHAPGASVIASLESVADDASALINQFLASDMVKAEIAGLSNHDLATLLVNNGLGTSDAGAIQFSENYLQAGHSVADLVLIGMNYAPVVNHAYGAEGLTLI